MAHFIENFEKLFKSQIAPNFYPCIECRLKMQSKYKALNLIFCFLFILVFIPVLIYYLAPAFVSFSSNFIYAIFALVFIIPIVWIIVSSCVYYFYNKKYHLMFKSFSLPIISQICKNIQYSYKRKIISDRELMLSGFLEKYEKRDAYDEFWGTYKNFDFKLSSDCIASGKYGSNCIHIELKNNEAAYDVDILRENVEVADKENFMRKLNEYFPKYKIDNYEEIKKVFNNSAIGICFPEVSFRGGNKLIFQIRCSDFLPNFNDTNKYVDDTYRLKFYMLRILFVYVFIDYMTKELK